MWPGKLAPGKGRSVAKLAPGEGTGRLVHGPGRLWPWPRRPGVRGAEDRGREGHEKPTGP